MCCNLGCDKHDFAYKEDLKFEDATRTNLVSLQSGSFRSYTCIPACGLDICFNPTYVIRSSEDAFRTTLSTNAGFR